MPDVWFGLVFINPVTCIIHSYYDYHIFSTFGGLVDFASTAKLNHNWYYFIMEWFTGSGANYNGSVVACHTEASTKCILHGT